MGVLTRGKAELKAFADGIFAAIPDFTVELSSRFTAGPGRNGMDHVRDAPWRSPGSPGHREAVHAAGRLDPRAVVGRLRAAPTTGTWCPSSSKSARCRPSKGESPWPR